MTYLDGISCRVILMSATVDAEKIAAYMGDCPVITVPGRTFPVTAHYLEEIVEMTRYRLEPTTDSPYVSRRMRREYTSAKTAFFLSPAELELLRRIWRAICKDVGER